MGPVLWCRGQEAAGEGEQTLRLLNRLCGQLLIHAPSLIVRTSLTMLHQLKLRGIDNVNEVFVLNVTAYNLIRLSNILKA
ncbi:MAG: hypothetical protein VKO39_03010 [Cyanobacteriota bacterium]|nr:hypothetical protein [Cyanobacteriota bacterium]